MSVTHDSIRRLAAMTGQGGPADFHPIVQVLQIKGVQAKGGEDRYRVRSLPCLLDVYKYRFKHILMYILQ
jgi:hypothetical protein